MLHHSSKNMSNEDIAGLSAFLRFNCISVTEKSSVEVGEAGGKWICKMEARIAFVIGTSEACAFHLCFQRRWFL